ncbi:MAG: SagB/ThcOx family dehydrogenase [Planctomycetota bacterium]|jgi:SagB-type dehydrogenase family enzyme
MPKVSILFLLLVGVIAVLALMPGIGGEKMKKGEAAKLPDAKKKGKKSLEEVIAARRSVRTFKDKALSEEQLSQLCWATQGITGKTYPLRAAPSAGALYPLEIYAVTAKGTFRYLPKEHSFRLELAGDIRETLRKSALGQASIAQAPCVFVFAGVISRTSKKYGERAARYVWIEAGHAGQNLLLQATALGLGGVPIGAFHDDQVKKALAMPEEETPLYILPIGKPKK